MDKLISFLFLSVSAVWIYHRTGFAETVTAGVFLPVFFASLFATAFAVSRIPAVLRGTGRLIAALARALIRAVVFVTVGLPVRTAKAIGRGLSAQIARLGFAGKAVFHLLRENSTLRRRVKDLQGEQDRLETELKFVVGQWLTAGTVKPKAAAKPVETAAVPARLTVSFAESATLGFIEDGSRGTEGVVGEQQQPQRNEEAQELSREDGSHGKSSFNTLN